ncbi:hypothetical protein MLD38_021303 [Melastoma candidum]|uniref:Uncharacterized protein n=1 Tax=Melastoma candidum TaxID=119954 RepID=A0ACB9QFJ7_9MYRT|nr:hypothetical protein MLD38_021303 [Melastoma candidum]
MAGKEGLRSLEWKRTGRGTAERTTSLLACLCECRDGCLHSVGSSLVAKLKIVFKELGEIVSFLFCIEFWIMAVLWNFSLLVSYVRLFINWMPQAKRVPQKASAKTARRPVCVVTGATSGLGAAAARALSREGFTVVLVGRSSHLLSKMAAEIQHDNLNASLKAFQVDVSSFQSILEFKNSLHEWLLESKMHLSIQLLINNAGILATSSRLSAEGYDQMMATNYIGIVLLTKLLLPLLRNSPVPSRIVNVSSFTHLNACTTQCDKDTVTGKKFLGMKHYPYARIYEYSKLCVLLFTYELHRQLQVEKCTSVSVNAADPGAVKSKIMRELPTSLSYAAFSFLNLLGLLSLPERGVNSILDAALASPDTSGLYFFGGNGRNIASSLISHNEELASQLWATSTEIFVSAEIAAESSSNSKLERGMTICG